MVWLWCAAGCLVTVHPLRWDELRESVAYADDPAGVVHHAMVRDA
jgi:hypothetical protein